MIEIRVREPRRKMFGIDGIGEPTFARLQRESSGLGWRVARNRKENAPQSRARIAFELCLRHAGFLQMKPVVRELSGLAQHVQGRRRAALAKGNAERRDSRKHV